MSAPACGRQAGRKGLGAKGAGRLATPEGHGSEKYITGTCLASSGRRWPNLLAERWRHAGGDLGDIKPRDTEVIVMLEGRTRVRRRGDGLLQEHAAAAGTVWLCPSGIAEDMIRLEREIRDSMHLYLPAETVARTLLADLDLDPGHVLLRYEGGFRDPLIESIARTVADEMASPDPLGGLLVEMLASALGVHLIRRYSSVSPAAVTLPSAKGALDGRRLARVLAFIDAGLDQPLRLDDIARQACLSPFHLARSFKAATGCSLHRYVAERRLLLARSMLSRDDCSLAEIALACGFSSQAHLSSSFKRVTGMTPGGFRRQTRMAGGARPPNP